MYVIIWEFVAKAGAEQTFEQEYGASGIWVEFFRQGQEYLGTELLRDPGTKARYVTVDRWTSQKAFEDFRASHLEEYQSIDQKCETLTESEILLGTFASIDSPGKE